MNLITQKLLAPFTAAFFFGIYYKHINNHVEKLKEIAQLQSDFIYWLPTAVYAARDSNNIEEFIDEFNERGHFLRMVIVNIAESDRKIRIFDEKNNRLDQ